ncbi:MAG: response regulator [Prevotella sp.]|jgi:signal transduction histidine kinase/ligand-binding sensor domain-containing protein|nr:response regulator [Prevotella sp.]
MLKKIVITFNLFLFCLCLTGQSDISKHLGVEEGLSNNYIADICQDGKGLIWIATESGLNRFDGRSFTVYTKNNSGLVSNELNALLYDKEDNTIWIGSQREGISIFDCVSNTFSNHTMDNGLITNDVTNLSHAADGGIWITHYHVGVEYYNKRTKEFTLYADRDIENMKSLNWCSVDDGNGNLYVGHTHDGLSIIDIKNRTARNIRHNPADPKSLPGNNVRSIHMDHQKNIWVGTNRGLALFNPKTEEFITFKHDPLNPHSLGSDYIFNINEMKDGTLWISTDMSGISVLNLNDITLVDPQKIKFQNIKMTGVPYKLLSTNVRCLFQDSFDNIWVGHYHKGIDFISKFSSVFDVLPYTTEKPDDAPEKQIWDIFIDKNDRLWIGSENEISVFQNNVLKKTIDIRAYLPKDKSNVYINKINSDKTGDIWLGTNNDGVLKLNPNNYRIETIQLNETGEYVRDFLEDANGKILIATENGLYSYLRNSVHKENLINDQLNDKTIYSLIYDKQGKLWVGTFGKGIFIFDNNKTLINNLETGKGFCSNAINSLYIDSKGGVWTATRNGLAYFENTNNPDKYEIYNEDHGLENSYIRAILEDKSGNIWISTNAGISLWNSKEKRFNNYNHKDGVPVGNFINSSACVKKDGTLYFGSINGVCYFNPSEITKEQQLTTPVQIVECLALNSQIENENQEILVPNKKNIIELPHNKNSFRIIFAAPDYSRNQLVEYAYQMEGLDDLWHNTLGDNQVTFRSIPSGNYTFKVKTRLKNQDWDESNIATLRLVIHPPIWLTWYAKVFYVALLCLIIVFLLRSYKRRVDLKTSLELERKNSQNKQELNDERLRFYTNITHELRTPLTLILGPLEDLIHDKTLSEPHNSKINIIHASAIRLLNLINQILEFRKTETQNRKLTVTKGNLANLVTEIGLRYKELNQNDRLSYLIDIKEKDVIIYFDADMITTILNNLLSNATKYTPNGEIRISLRSVLQSDNKYIEIAISDTGYGIEADALPHIFDRYYQAKGKLQSSGTGIGLALVKSLVGLHEGILNVESKIGEGTTFSFRLLAENTYPDALHTEKKVNQNIIEEEIDSIKEENDNKVLRILVVEDDKDIREYIITSLENEYSILFASNGIDGLTLAQKYIPNIIVSDIMMPEMDGIELCRRIKDDIRTSHIPVILLTAKDSIQDKEEGYESGADSYLTKPFSARLLRSRIYNLLESRKKLAEQINLQAKGGISELENLEKDLIKISKLDEEFLNKLTEIIENNLEMEELDIAFIKEKMNMSYSSFYRKIKGLTDGSPNEFIRKIRLKCSLQFLLTGSYNISEIAYMSGFNDVVYFRKCFKEEYGVSPSEYRKKI